MRRNLKKNKSEKTFSLSVFGCFLILSGFFCFNLYASHQEDTHKEDTHSKDTHKEVPTIAYCAELEKFEGVVEVIESSRQHLIDLKPEGTTLIPCGAWVSSREGWARVRHFQGPEISVGASTLIQVADFNQFTESTPKDQITVYKGQIYIEGAEGTEHFRVVSSSARADISEAKAIFVFDAMKDLTQLIVLDKAAYFENRFEPKAKKIKVELGQASELDLRLQRVVPTSPTGVSISSLTPKFSELQIHEQDQARVTKAAIEYEKKIHAEDLLEDTALDKTADYQSHHKTSSNDSSGSKETQSLKNHFQKKILGGTSHGKDVLHPKHSDPKAIHKAFKLNVRDASGKRSSADSYLEHMEKKRLMHELSTIQSD